MYYLKQRKLIVLPDFKIARSTRRCASLDRPLKPGESYWSVLTDRDEELIRIDISAEAWTGPPAGSLGAWKNQMPVSDNRRLRLAPDPVLCDLLHQLAGDAGREEVSYLLALLLLRRRLVRVCEGSDVKPGMMRLEFLQDGSEVTVRECEITPREAKRLQADLTELLYCEAE